MFTTLESLINTSKNVIFKMWIKCGFNKILII